MSKRPLISQAMDAIPYGAPVLVRGGRVSLAGENVANGITCTPPWPRVHGHWEWGDHVAAEPIEGIGERSLQALADGPIMQPLRLYLPAGRLSEEEYQARLDLQFREAGIERGA